MLLETHCHSSRHSKCSRVDPVSLVKQVLEKGLQGIVITEHLYLWGEEELARLRKEAEVEDNFVILAGQEAETDIGHVLVFGADKSITERIALADLRKTYPRAALVWAHPFRGGKVPDSEELLNPMLDAVEIFNSNQDIKENYLGLKAWHKYKFTAVGGTDTHENVVAGSYPTLFDHPVQSIGGLVEEIKGARCRPFFKEIPKSGSNIVVTEITLGTKGQDEIRDRIILKDISDEKKWKSVKKNARITEKLYGRGFDSGQFRVPRILDMNDSEMTLMEEGQRGKKLFDLMLRVDPSVAKEYFRLAAKWLARMHNEKLKVCDAEETARREAKRFESYRKSFIDSNSPYTEKAVRIIDRVKSREEEMIAREKDLFVQNHGDFHPKNIIIGQDRMHDISTLFVSVIDFDSSMFFDRAFDVGYFISQMLNQFSGSPHVLEEYTEDDFIESYLEEAGDINRDVFLEKVGVFKMRANLSIASFLIKVGKGESPEMEGLMNRSLVA